MPPTDPEMNARFTPPVIAATPAPTAPHAGMPPLDASGPALSAFEFWPMWRFYPPVLLYALWLMVRHRGVLLPTVANPSFPGGGFYGESKAEILALAVERLPEWVAPFIPIDRAPAASVASVDAECLAAETAMCIAGLAYPVVAKPDLGCRGAGVKLVRDRAQLARYIDAFPPGARFVLQRLVPHQGEAGVFYCRRPGQGRGRIISITLKYFPHVYGDGRSTLRELIHADPRAGALSHLYLPRHRDRLDTVPAEGEAIRLAFAGSHSRGAIFRDGTAFVTPDMEAAFEAIARRLPEFHFGRFDIRFPDFDAVRAGRGFTIVEINGGGAESTHIWDRSMTLTGAWRALMNQYRWLFEIGAANRARGHLPMSITEFVRAYRREKFLTPRYPATD